MAKRKSSGLSGKLVCGVMAFLLAVFLTMSVVLPVLYFTLLSSSAFTRTFKSVGYYETLYEHSIEQVRPTLTPTGFPDSILDGVLTVDEVRQIVDGKVTGTIADEEVAALADGMRERMVENMYAYMDSNGYSRDMVSEGDLELIAEGAISSVVSYTTFPLIGRLRSYFSLYLKLAVIGVIVFVGLSVLLCKLIHSLSIWKHVYLRNVAFGTGGASAMLLAFPLFILIWGGYKRIALGNVYLFDFVQKLINNTVFALIAGGVVMLGVTVALAVVSEKSRAQARHRKRRGGGDMPSVTGLPDL